MPFTHINLDQVDDAAQGFGFGEVQEARFCNEALGTEQTGFSLHRIKAGKRQGFAHHHREAEEVYVVLSGSGRVKLDSEVVELRPFDAVRIPGPVTRAFEADSDGLEILAFGPRRDDDRGEIVEGRWAD